MTDRRTGGLDWFRLWCALLVIANHTSPLQTLSPDADHLLTQVLARTAVPFFLMVTGYFLLPAVEEKGRKALLPFLQKGLLLYAGVTLLYLPLQLYKGYRPGPLQILRDLVFDGTFYHLWYFPALLLGAALVCLLPRRGLPLWGLLYLLGLLGDSYYGLTAALPAGKTLYDVLFLCFDQTRNGLFLAPIFLYLGGRLTKTPPRRDRRFYGWAALAALLLLTGEGLLVKGLELARYSTMYLSLPLVMWLLFRWLCALELPQRPSLRRLSTVVYVVHPWMIVAVRGCAKVMGLSELVVGSPFLFFALVTLSSFGGGVLWCRFLPLNRPKKVPSPPLALPRPLDAPRSPVRCWAEVDLSAVRHNIGVLRRCLPEGCQLMAVVKADGYGHGAEQIARACAAQGVDAFAVATVEEGTALRRSGVSGDILVLGRSFPAEFSDALRYDLTLTAADDLHAGELAAFGSPLRVHIAVDTGMHRLGFPCGDMESIAALYRNPQLKVEGLYTHFCTADSGEREDIAYTEEQARAFFSLVEFLRGQGITPGVLHLQASAGILHYRGLPCGYARPGLALYGVGGGDLRPALTLKCRVAAVRTLSPGDTAGYERAFTAQRPTRLAVLTIGYADGLPRALGGRGYVLIHGKAAPIVGRVCMDQTLADVTEIGEVLPGSEVIVIGPGLPAAAVAKSAGTIPNELLSRLGGRVERVYRETSSP